MRAGIRAELRKHSPTLFKEVMNSLQINHKEAKKKQQNEQDDEEMKVHDSD